MGKDKLVILGVFLLAIGGTVAFRFLYDAERGANASDTPIQPSRAGEFRGICLQIHNSDPDHPYEEYISQIARTGANTVKIVVNAYQENAQASSIFIEARKTPPYARMVSMCAHARKQGLRVILMPILLLDNPRGSEWRGTIRPGNWDDWWSDYTDYIVYNAKLARDGKADVYIIGSELISTETQTSRWRTLIRKVRKYYKGRITYSANWDHYEAVKFWDDLDLIGMTTYYDLQGTGEPTLENILEHWGPIKAKILKWQKTVQRPILFTEVGWPNLITAAKYPWDYTKTPQTPDVKQQAACFEAFFQTWFHERNVAGYLVWEWRNSPSDTSGPNDTGYFPEGKPAMGVIKKYFAKPSPWPTTAPTSQPAATE